MYQLRYIFKKCLSRITISYNLETQFLNPTTLIVMLDIFLEHVKSFQCAFFCGSHYQPRGCALHLIKSSIQYPSFKKIRFFLKERAELHTLRTYRPNLRLKTTSYLHVHTSIIRTNCYYLVYGYVFFLFVPLAFPACIELHCFFLQLQLKYLLIK